MQTHLYPTINRLARSKSAWLTVGLITMAVVSFWALLPVSAQPSQPAESVTNTTAVNVQPNASQHLLNVNEQFYPSNATMNTTSTAHPPRLLALNEMFYPSNTAIAANPQSTQKLFALNEQFYPSNVAASEARPQNAQRLRALNEQLYPAAATTAEEPTFWIGHPH